MLAPKYAKLEVLDVKSAPQRVTSGLSKFADFGDYKTEDGFLYVRVRAISSRVNKNHDGWPAAELKKAYKTFVGKPIFVDHHNSDPTKARGVVVDAALHEEDVQKTSAHDPYYASAPANHLPPTWIELLLEVDAKAFPKLAKAIVAGDIDGVSMGANVERSICSHCENEARNPDEYCKHILSKGAYFDFHQPDGTKISKKAYEDCYDIGFFELSFVFDPADETALKIDHKQASRRKEIMFDILSEEMGPRTAMAKVAALDLPVPELEDPPEFGNEAYEEERSPKDDEAERVLAWRIEQLIQAGYDPETAKMLAVKEIGHAGEIGERPIYPDLMRTIERGATPEQAQEIWAKTAATDDEFMFHVSNDHSTSGMFCEKCDARIGMANECHKCGHIRGSQKADPFAGPFPAKDLTQHIFDSKTADRNPPPQSEMATAPDQVDTLRQEQICPICGSDMDEGVCEVCNYEEPPEGFDNPDLEKAKEVDQQMRQEDAQQAAQGQQPMDSSQIEQEPGAGPQMGMAPGSPSMTTSKAESTVGVSVERQDSEKTSRINTQERPILPATRKLTDKPLNPKTVKDSKQPVESNRKENKENMSETTQKIADGATPAGEGVQAEKRVDVEGVGGVSGDPLSGIEHENVEKDTGDFVAPHTDTWSGDEGDSLGQQEAVTSEVPEDLFSVASTKTAEGIQTWDPPGNGFPDHDPARVDLEAPLAEEVGGPTATDSNEEFRSQKVAPPVTQEDGSAGGGPIGDALASVKAQVFKAMKVADTEAELGLINSDARFDRAGELESSSEEALDARLDTLARVKTAGISKRTKQPKLAGRVPSFRQPTASFDIEAHSVGVEVDDALAW